MVNWIESATRLWNRCYNLFLSTDHFITNAIKIIMTLLIGFVILPNISSLTGIEIKEKRKKGIDWICAIVSQRAITGLASFFSGDVPSWKASWTVRIAMFTISCYFLEECVKMKRAQLARALLDP